ncbi:TPA: oxidoreductase [Candidatus Latescibacteria bacterium]|nr:oxidoreductase [Candidatus Latescibacterota bacterium]
MVGIGIVGIGFMGMTHFRAARKVRRGRVTAICSRSDKKLQGDWRGIRGNFGDPGGREDLSRIGTYAEFDDLLSDPKVDLVDICMPTSDHCDAAVRALRAGKHVLVEKPIALSLRDADRMVREADRAGKHLMVAHVLPFFSEYAFLADCVQSGQYGALQGAHLKRIISRPDWSSDFSNVERSGGPGIDLHIHDTHFIVATCGTPDRVSAVGRLIDPTHASYIGASYRYENDPSLSITCTGGAIAQKGRPFVHGFEAYFEQATVLYEFGTVAGKVHLAQPLTVLTADGKSRRPRTGSGNPLTAFTKEIQSAVDAVLGGGVAAEISGEVARNALAMCFKEVRAIQTGRPVRI